MAAEPDAYNCDTCEVRQRQAALDADNRRALVIWGRLGRRLVLEHGLADYTLQALTREWSDEDRADLVERLAVLYDVFVPQVRTDGA